MVGSVQEWPSVKGSAPCCRSSIIIGTGMLASQNSVDGAGDVDDGVDSDVDFDVDDGAGGHRASWAASKNGRG